MSYHTSVIRLNLYKEQYIEARDKYFNYIDHIRDCMTIRWSAISYNYNTLKTTQIIKHLRCYIKWRTIYNNYNISKITKIIRNNIDTGKKVLSPLGENKDIHMTNLKMNPIDSNNVKVKIDSNDSNNVNKENEQNKSKINSLNENKYILKVYLGYNIKNKKTKFNIEEQNIESKSAFEMLGNDILLNMYKECTEKEINNFNKNMRKCNINELLNNNYEKSNNLLISVIKKKYMRKNK